MDPAYITSSLNIMPGAIGAKLLDQPLSLPTTQRGVRIFESFSDADNYSFLEIMAAEGGDFILRAAAAGTGVKRGIAFENITYSDTYFKDEMVELVGINPAGSATNPSVDPSGEGWLFAGGSSDNVSVLGRQINHDCKQGLITIYPHIHWRKTTNASGNVGWKLEVKYAAPGGDFGNYAQVGTNQYTPVAGTVDNNTAVRHLITSFGPLELDVDLSTKIYFKLTRVASVTASDTYAADALAMSFDYHYPVDSPGSASEYSKN